MKMNIIICSSILLLLCACSDSKPSITVDSNSAASSFTQQSHQQIRDYLDLSDSNDFKLATKGLLAKAPMNALYTDDGDKIWDPKVFQFIKGDAPDTVNPSLWRQAKLNQIRGLFKVSEGIYQLRGFDLANMTLIDSDNGWVVLDPLTTIETARQAINFARQHLGNKAIKAVVFSHSHIDHFGGALGVLSLAEAKQDKIPIIAPSGFMYEATSENIVAGPAMFRRAMLMYGMALPRNPQGHIDTGLGIQPMVGKTSIMQPSIIINNDYEQHIIDGVVMDFYNMPNSEAPAEMVIGLPKHHALFGAELVSRNQHNIYTLRGAKVRDALQWSDYIDQLVQQDTTFNIYFGSHHWPIWGADNIQHFLSNQRDLYKYIHDQTIRLANNGLTSKEIAEQIKLPDTLAKPFYNRGYYGTVKHNSKAVYQYYFGWYDANPANLDPLPPEQVAKKYVAVMGGAEAILTNAQQSFEKGDYRWVAELLNHLVFAQPKNRQAKKLLAKTYQQLGFQAESGPWRDVYLSAAQELLHGTPQLSIKLQNSYDILAQMPIIQFLKSMSVKLKAENTIGKTLSIGFYFSDLQEYYVVDIRNSVMHYREADKDTIETDATLVITHPLFLDLLIGNVSLVKALLSDDLSIEGSKTKLASFFALLEDPEGDFNIVTP